MLSLLISINEKEEFRSLVHEIVIEVIEILDLPTIIRDAADETSRIIKPTTQRWYQPGEAAKFLGISTEALQGRRLRGQIKAHKVAGMNRYQYSRDELERHLESPQSGR